MELLFKLSLSLSNKDKDILNLPHLNNLFSHIIILLLGHQLGKWRSLKE